MEWFRWYPGTVSDPKLRVVARRAEVPVHAVLAVWAAILENASDSSDRGSLERFDAESVGAALDLDANQVQAILTAMRGRLMDNDRLTGWDRRQPKREDQSTERVRRHRERQKDAPDEEMKRTVTQCNAPEKSRGERDTDTDTTSSVLKLHAGEATGIEDQMDLVIRAANRGMIENPAIGSLANPIPTSHGSRECVREWLDLAPFDVVQRAVYERAKEYKPDGRRRQITTMAYFTGAVKDTADRWRASQTEVSDGADRGSSSGRDGDTGSTREAGRGAAPKRRDRFADRYEDAGDSAA